MRPFVVTHTTSMQYVKPIIVFRPGKDINMIKLCKKCRYFEPAGQRCKLFGNINLVDGTLDLNFSAIERSLIGQCGPEGQYWQHIVGEEKLYDKLTAMQYKTLVQMIEESENNEKCYDYDSNKDYCEITHWD